MEREAFYHVPRLELSWLLRYLSDPAGPAGVLLLGEPGAGKTTLLSVAARELEWVGRPAFIVQLNDVEGKLGDRVLRAIEISHRSVVAGVRTVSGSSGYTPPETTEILRRAGKILGRPVLMLDALDESYSPARVASEIAALSRSVGDHWKIVVTSRSRAAGGLGRLGDFRVLELPGFTFAEAASVVRALTPSLSDSIVESIILAANGNPLLLQTLARRLGTSAAVVEAATSVPDAFDGLVNDAIAGSSNPALLGELLERLALAGGRERIASLALKTHQPERTVVRLVQASGARSLVVVDESAGTAALFHDILRDVIVARRILTSPFRIADLSFGDEEAEADELLDKTYVRRPHVEAILGQKRPIVVGDRGAGKSAIFRKLSSGPPEATAGDAPDCTVLPVPKPYELLHKILNDDKAWLDTDTIRAAWLLIVASAVAAALPATAPKELRRDAASIRAALGFPVPPASLPARVLGAATGMLGGTTLKFTAGPAQVEVDLPDGSGSRLGKAPVDVSGFLDEANKFLEQSGSRAVVTVDQIDEIAKWDASRQQAVVRSLLQTVRDVHQRGHIQFVVFLRTDLYTRCDVQEKTKLVSKTVTLSWEEEDWLQVLVRRVLANEPFQRLAPRLRDARGNVDVIGTLQVLFPGEIEGQPADRWLIDSLRNGNGNVPPRLAVNLLSLLGDQVARPLDTVSALPLFTADEAGRAMTKLSDLSFDELVNDFKVSPSFALNCRAGKLETFAKKDVEDLFNVAEGDREEQILVLERLGFLERIVREHDDGRRESLFRIPKLYTRCWDHA